MSLSNRLDPEHAFGPCRCEDCGAAPCRCPEVRDSTDESQIPFALDAPWDDDELLPWEAA
jgi:hypothetical protein